MTRGGVLFRSAGLPCIAWPRVSRYSCGLWLLLNDSRCMLDFLLVLLLYTCALRWLLFGGWDPSLSASHHLFPTFPTQKQRRWGRSVGRSVHKFHLFLSHTSPSPMSTCLTQSAVFSSIFPCRPSHTFTPVWEKPQNTYRLRLENKRVTAFLRLALAPPLH